MKQALMLAVIVATGSSVATAQSSLAGRWQGEDRGRGGRAIPVVLELSVDNTTVSGTVKDGDAPAGPIANGRFANGTLTFTTCVFLNGNEIVLTWEGTLDGDRLPLVRTLPNGTALPPLDMRRNKKRGRAPAPGAARKEDTFSSEPTSRAGLASTRWRSCWLNRALDRCEPVAHVVLAGTNPMQRDQPPDGRGDRHDPDQADHQDHDELRNAQSHVSPLSLFEPA